MTHLTRDPLTADAALRSVQAAERGGTCLFMGTVRPDDGALAIEYSAHEEMAERELGAIVAEAHTQWPAVAMTVTHRLGEVRVGEASVIVGGAAPHRAESFDACRFVIEALKVRVPIWKREIYADGAAQWVDNQGNKRQAQVE